MVARADPVVQMVGLTKIFKDFWNRNKVVAVDSLDVEIFPKEVFGLLGPNGSGKTTTIKVLLGLLYPTKGMARVFGRSPLDVRTNSRIGYLPEESYLYRFLNARETLDYYGRLFGQSRPLRRKRIEALLDMVGLSKIGSRPVGQFSKGMARRIGLAQALINDPDLLILDEPTTGLDPIGTKQIKDLIVELGRRGKTIILCSHLLSEVEDVCDRVCILYGGRRRAMGTLEELLSRQEMTQITAPRLKAETIERVREVIQSSEGTDEVSVQAPTDRLESFFLRIVREAQQARVATSGAAAEGKIADFLAAGPERAGEQVIERLMEAPTPTPIAESAPVAASSAATPAGGERRDVVDGLLESAESTTRPDDQPAVQEETRPGPAADEQVDRKVIDGLVSDQDTDK